MFSISVTPSVMCTLVGNWKVERNESFSSIHISCIDFMWKGFQCAITVWTAVQFAVWQSGICCHRKRNCDHKKQHSELSFLVSHHVSQAKTYDCFPTNTGENWECPEINRPTQTDMMGPALGISDMKFKSLVGLYCSSLLWKVKWLALWLICMANARNIIPSYKRNILDRYDIREGLQTDNLLPWFGKPLKRVLHDDCSQEIVKTCNGCHPNNIIFQLLTKLYILVSSPMEHGFLDLYSECRKLHRIFHYNKAGF